MVRPVWRATSIRGSGRTRSSSHGSQGLPAAEALFRIRKIALATLTTLGEADGLAGPCEETEIVEPASGWFSDDDGPDQAA
jgi:hypothetical protein